MRTASPIDVGFARAVRQQAGLSIRGMARSLGVAHTSLLRWERGEMVPQKERAATWRRLLTKLAEEPDQR